MIRNVVRPSGNVVRPSGNVVRPSGNGVRPSGNVVRPSGNGVRPSGTLTTPGGGLTSSERNETVFWSLFGVVVFLSIGALVIGIIALKNDRLKIINVNETVIAGSVTVKNKVQAEENLYTTKTWLAKGNDSVSSTLTAVTANYHDTLAFGSNVSIGADNIPSLYNSTTWASVGLADSHVTLLSDIKANTPFFVPLDTVTLKVVANNTIPGSNLTTFKQNGAEQTQSWFSIPKGGWLVTVSWKFAFSAADLEGSYSCRLIGYDNSLKKWTVASKNASCGELAAAQTETGSVDLPATYVNGTFSSLIHMPSRNVYDISNSDPPLINLGVQFEGQVDKDTTLTSTHIVVTVFQTMPI